MVRVAALCGHGVKIAAIIEPNAQVRFPQIPPGRGHRGLPNDRQGALLDIGQTLGVRRPSRGPKELSRRHSVLRNHPAQRPNTRKIVQCARFAIRFRHQSPLQARHISPQPVPVLHITRADPKRNAKPQQRKR